MSQAPKQVAFIVQSAQPVILLVEGADGSCHEVRLATAIFSVTDSGPEATSGRFNVRANVAVESRVISPNAADALRMLLPRRTEDGEGV